MNNDMFQKLLAGERNKLEYKLMRYYYNKEMDINKKVSFMFEQYTDTLKDISHNNSYFRESDNVQLTPDQIDKVTSILGGLFLEYIMKVQGKDLSDALSDALDEFINDLEEDNNDYEE